MHNIHEFVIKYGWEAAFVVTATSIPDDAVYITLGLFKIQYVETRCGYFCWLVLE